MKIEYTYTFHNHPDEPLVWHDYGCYYKVDNSEQGFEAIVAREGKAVVDNPLLFDGMTCSFRLVDGETVVKEVALG